MSAQSARRRLIGQGDTFQCSKLFYTSSHERAEQTLTVASRADGLLHTEPTNEQTSGRNITASSTGLLTARLALALAAPTGTPLVRNLQLFKINLEMRLFAEGRSPLALIKNGPSAKTPGKGNMCCSQTFGQARPIALTRVFGRVISIWKAVRRTLDAQSLLKVTP